MWPRQEPGQSKEIPMAQAHASIGRYRFDLVVTRTTIRAPWWKRFKQAVYERLMADTPPTRMAQAFAYTYGAAPIPVR